MAKVRNIQASFVSGELDPSMLGRVDTTLYSKSAKKLENVYIRPQGGAFRREGLQYLDGLTNNDKGRLIPFEFNTEQTYILVFTSGKFKVYRTDVPGTAQATVSSSPIDALTADNIEKMTFVQSADTLLLFNNDFKPIKITRTSHTSWTAVEEGFTNIPNFNYGSGNEPVMSSTRGWPAVGTFYKSRLWLGFVGERPQTILASVIGDFFNFDEGNAEDDRALNITIDDDRVNQIRNFFPGRGLQIYTSGGEFTIRSGLNEPITPSNIAQLLNKETLHGITKVPPQSVDGTTIFIEQKGSIVRQFTFNEVEQSFNAINISIKSQHLIRDPVAMDIRRSVPEEPTDYLFLVNKDGTAAVLNSLREQELLAWSQITTEGEFEDVAVSNRIAYFIVKRTINGSTVRYLEALNQDHFTDASTLQTSGTATTSWSNLSHLNGETVKVRGDDFILDNEDVASDSITSSKAVKQLEAGINFKAKVKALPLEVVIEGQTFSGEWKSLQKVMLKLLDSRNVVVDIGGKTTRPAFRSFGDNTLDQAISLFTGWVQIIGGGVSRDVDVTFTQEEPLEFKILNYTFTVRI